MLGPQCWIIALILCLKKTLRILKQKNLFFLLQDVLCIFFREKMAFFTRPTVGIPLVSLRSLDVDLEDQPAEQIAPSSESRMQDPASSVAGLRVHVWYRRVTLTLPVLSFWYGHNNMGSHSDNSSKEKLWYYSWARAHIYIYIYI